MSDTPDPATAYLAEVRERWDTADKATWHDYATALEHLAKALRSLADVPRLLAAVEAVLKPHARAGKPTRTWDLDLRCDAHDYTRRALRSFSEVRDCPDCRYRDRFYCVNRDCREHEWPCPTYAAITTALLGEDGTDG